MKDMKGEIHSFEPVSKTYENLSRICCDDIDLYTEGAKLKRGRAEQVMWKGIADFTRSTLTSGLS